MSQPAGDQQQQGDQGAGSGDQGGSQQAPPAGGQGQQQTDLDAPKFSQRHVNNLEASMRREYKAKHDRDEELINKGKQLETQQAEQAPLSERVSTLSAESATKDGRISALEVEKTRLQMAYDAGLPPVLGKLVQGNTKEEIEAHIEELKPLAGAPQGAGTQQQGSGVTPNQQQGMPSADNNRTGSVSTGRDLYKDKHGAKEAASSGSN